MLQAELKHGVGVVPTLLVVGVNKPSAICMSVDALGEPTDHVNPNDEIGGTCYRGTLEKKPLDLRREAAFKPL